MAMNQVYVPSFKTISVLSEVEDKIRAEPHVFTEFVKILESEPAMRSQANKLVKIHCGKGKLILGLNEWKHYHSSDNCRV